MREYLVYNGPHKLFGGRCMVYRFPSDWGASVVRHQASKGGPEGFWELALISFPEKDHDNFYIRLDTELMHEVQGYQFIDEVLTWLDIIKQLPQATHDQEN